ncbi:hypothetical protein KZ829_26195 [Actinoplanes hulinensis]|uniref:Uncharacterized protein n=1 Tax=Actinoplanes hulinensis TaxID=1144547 RepID=A0ABS7B881_9ACTN|nr:hypothetical protein [Actinoplanes hulinensis]MBW6437231.1 hypothetical protein [Actinoplanes hulinensis]
MTSIDDDSPKPQDTRAETVPEPAEPEPAARKPLNSSWVFTLAGLIAGAYFMINGALMLREKQGDGVFALIITGTVVVVAVIGGVLLKSYLAERAARK